MDEGARKATLVHCVRNVHREAIHDSQGLQYPFHGSSRGMSCHVRHESKLVTL